MLLLLQDGLGLTGRLPQQLPLHHPGVGVDACQGSLCGPCGTLKCLQTITTIYRPPFIWINGAFALEGREGVWGEL